MAGLQRAALVWALITPAFSAPNSVCRACHASIVDAYQQTGMASTFGPLKAARPIEDFGQNKFTHTASSREYRVEQRDGRLYQRRFQRDEQGREVRIFELGGTHVIGSGRHARTYLHFSEAGELVQLPDILVHARRTLGYEPRL